MVLNAADYINAALPDVAAVKALVNVTNHDLIPFAVVELLDWQNAPKNVLPDGTNNLTTNGYILSCTWRKNEADDVQGSADLVLLKPADSYIVPGSDHVRIWQGYFDHAGNEIQLFPVGTYLFGIADRDIEDGEREYTAKVYDESYVLTQLLFKYEYVGPRGCAYTTLLTALLEMDYRVPADGGRQPSGVSTLPAPTSPTVATGVLASSVCVLNPVTGYLDSPNGPLGVISYNPYDTRVRCDPRTFAPISPMTGTAMQLVTAASSTTLTSFYDPALGLYFQSPTGTFLLQQSAGAYMVVDPFKKAPYQTGSFVKQPNPLGGGSPFGFYTPPMTTWPYDWDGSGPYYTTSTASLVTVL